MSFTSLRLLMSLSSISLFQPPVALSLSMPELSFHSPSPSPSCSGSGISSQRRWVVVHRGSFFRPRASVSDGENSKNFTEIAIGGLFLRCSVYPYPRICTTCSGLSRPVELNRQGE